MGILENIKLYVNAFFYGLKSADQLISPYAEVSQLSLTNHTITVSNLLMDLLQGILSQEVISLRYSMYLINEKADEYKYIGNGLCVKRDAPTRNKPVVTQYQRDLEMTQSNVNDWLGKIDVEKNELKNYLGTQIPKTVNLFYNRMPPYNFNNALQRIKLDKKNLTATLYFLTDEGYTSKSKATAKYLKETFDLLQTRKDERQKSVFIKKNFLLGNVESIDMETYKCDGEYDGAIYHLTGTMFDSIKQNESDKHILEVKFTYHKLTIDNKFTIDMVYDKVQDELYKSKAKKKDKCIEWADALFMLYGEKETDFRKRQMKNVNFEVIDFSNYAL